MTAKQEARNLIEYADSLAEAMLDDMDGEACVDMVRQFCVVMASWQPSIKESLDDPFGIGLHCLATAQLFKLAFAKGYGHTSNRLDAIESIKKALGES